LSTQFGIKRAEYAPISLIFKHSTFLAPI